MHISFINSLLGGDFSALDIALTSLATYVNEKTDHSASVIDLTFHRKHWRETLRKGIEKNKPDVIGVSCNTMYMQYVRTIIKEIKEKYKLPVVLGGHHASIYPEETINIPECDAVVIGDGEEPLTKYLDNLSRANKFDGISGLWVKENENIVKNDRGCFRKNLDDLPVPNWDLWEDIDKYFYFLGMLYIIGSRGCPYKCTFCDAHGIAESVGGEYFRLRNPVQYAQEIAYQFEKYKNRDMRLAQLFDPVFTMNDQWVEEFSAEYRRLGIADKCKYSAFSRIDHLNEKKIKTLAKSGCALLRVGIECGDDFVRKEVYHKRINDDQIRSLYKLAHDNGIGFTTFFILGGPGESRKTIKKTIKLAVDLKSERTAFFIFKPFTADAAKQIEQYGGWIDQSKWQKADNITFDAVVHLKDLAPWQIELYQKKAYFLTFGRRLLKILWRLKFLYFIWLLTYIFRGLFYGLDFMYLITYFHIYGYDNVDK